MMEWNDFQIILAIYRTGTLSDSARLLKVNQSTISRALQRIEAQAKQRIFIHLSGRYQVTSEGKRFIRAAESFDKIAEEFSHQETVTAQVAGTVRLTSIEAFVTGYLLSALAEFKKRFPHISFELNGSNETMNLLKRGYDLSLRFEREQTSGSLIQKKIAEIGVGVYAQKAAAKSKGPPSALARDWIGYETALSQIPEEKWLRAKFKGDVPSVRVSGYLAMEKSIATGLGIGLLPCFMGDKNPQLQRLEPRAVLNRSIWLITHPEARREPGVESFIKWLSIKLDNDQGLLLGIEN